MKTIQEIKEIREPYTKEVYSPKLIKELLYELFEFITSNQVEKLNYFCDYDKSGLLCAIETIEHQEKQIKRLKAFIENNEFDLTPEFSRHFPNGY